MTTAHATAVFTEGVSKYAASKDYAMKYLHPPTPKGPNYAGIPDNNNSPSAHLEYRLTHSSGQGIAAGTGVDLIYLVAPGMSNLLFQATQYPLAAGTSNRWTCEPLAPAPGTTNWGQYNNYLSLRDVSTLSSARMAYRSTTFYLNTNDLTNKGTVTVGNFRPNVETFTNMTQFRIGMAHCKNIGKFCDEVQKNWELLNCKSKDAYEIVHSKADPFPYVPIGQMIQVVKLGDALISEQQVQQLSPNSVTWLAREGAFVRTFFSQPTANYKTLNTSFNASGANNYFLTCYEYNDPFGTPFVQYFLTDPSADPGLPTNACKEFAWFDNMWSYVFFKGLDPASMVTMKTIVGYEAQPLVGSMMATQMKSSALPDNQCLESLSSIVHVAPDALEAKYNDEGDVATGKETLAQGGESAIDVSKALVGEQLELNKEVKEVKGLGEGIKKKRVKVNNAVTKVKDTFNPVKTQVYENSTLKGGRQGARIKNPGAKNHIRVNTRSGTSNGNAGQRRKRTRILPKVLGSNVKTNLNKEAKIISKLKKMLL